MKPLHTWKFLNYMFSPNNIKHVPLKASPCKSGCQDRDPQLADYCLLYAWNCFPAPHGMSGVRIRSKSFVLPEKTSYIIASIRCRLQMSFFWIFCCFWDWFVFVIDFFCVMTDASKLNQNYRKCPCSNRSVIGNYFMLVVVIILF